MLASMSETDWIDVSVGELPTGTVTLLLPVQPPDVEIPVIELVLRPE